SCHDLPRDVTRRVRSPVSPESGEILVARAPIASARTAVVSIGQWRRTGFRCREYQTPYVGREDAPGPNQPEWIARVENQASRPKPAATGASAMQRDFGCLLCAKPEPGL